MDDYLTHISNYYEQEPEKQVMNPVAYIHNFHPPQVESNLNFSLLLTLASVCNANNKEILWGFIKRYDKNLTPENSVVLDKMVGFAVKYYNDFIKLNKEYKEPTEEDKELLKAFLAKLESMPSNVTGEEIQNGLYDLCRELKIETKFLFFSLYELLLGQKQGPRWGSFIALHGIENIIKKAKEVIDV
jgi:lysyl-tRNA synthetase class 1